MLPLLASNPVCLLRSDIMPIYTLTIYIHKYKAAHKNKHNAPMPLNGTQLRLNLKPTPLLGKINQWRINGERELRRGVCCIGICARAYVLRFVGCERVRYTIYQQTGSFYKIKFSSWLVFRLSGCKSVLSCRSCWKNVLTKSSRLCFSVPTYLPTAPTSENQFSKWLWILNNWFLRQTLCVV